MRRRLNVRFLAYVLVSIAVLSVGTYFAHGYQVKRNAESLLTQADMAKEKKDLRQEADFLGRYLGFKPNATDVLIRYGELLADPQLAKTPRDEYRAYLVLESTTAIGSPRHPSARRQARDESDPRVLRQRTR
ncbi:MAG: hypothetical protein U0746_16560 [Gemmataceae bacterium]